MFRGETLAGVGTWAAGKEEFPFYGFAKGSTPWNHYPPT
jgi:hypothetical protein